MAGATYPASTAEAGLRLYLRWFGGYYARSTSMDAAVVGGGLLFAEVTVGRKWSLAVTVADLLALDAELGFEAARAAIEQRLDAGGRSLALWVPRGVRLPEGEPGISELVAAAERAVPADEARLEARLPIDLYLRRNDTSGSVVTVIGGLGNHWAQFTNRVPGSFFLNSVELHRMPVSQEWRDGLTERIVRAAGQPEADDTQVLATEDAWTVNDLGLGGSCVLGTPRPENDEHSSALRRHLRQLLRAANEAPRPQADAHALVVLGAATYADEEKLSWALKGVDPLLYSSYDLLAVIADGVVKPLLTPGRARLPWDAPLPGAGEGSGVT